MPTSAREAYERRLEHFTRRLVRCEQGDRRLSLARGITFCLGLTLLIVMLMFGGPSPAWLLLPAGVFVVLVIIHQSVLRRLARAERGRDWHQRGLDRLAERWDPAAPSGRRYLAPSHPYAEDLDLFGEGSLFQRLWRGATRLGEDRLADWLLEPASREKITARQQAVIELRSRHDLREAIGLLEEPPGEGNQNLLRAWSGNPPRPIETPYRLVMALLTILFLGTALAWFLEWGPASWVIIAYLLALGFLLLLRNRITEAIGHLGQADAGLAPLQDIARIIERERFESPLLREILASLETEGQRCAVRIAELNGLARRFDSTVRNQFVAMFAIPLGIPVHLAHAAECWRMRFGDYVPGWLEAIGEFEALLSIAGYAAENPDDQLAKIVTGPPSFEARGLGHPLLPMTECVRNDVHLGGDPRLLVISGSNMAGKSTLLRAVGLGAVLAQAGAPVRAERLVMTPLHLGTVIRVSDSLQSGKSTFFAAIERLKQIAILSEGSTPLLFLLDELLAGTNSHDRRIGAEEILRRLLERGAIGIVTTHDLALTEIADALAPAATNQHFRDELIDGRMHFDYTLRPGRVTRGNALALMRLVGLMNAEEVTASEVA